MDEQKLGVMRERILEAAKDIKDPIFNDIGRLNIAAAIGEMVIHNADLIAKAMERPVYDTKAIDDLVLNEPLRYGWLADFRRNS